MPGGSVTNRGQLEVVLQNVFPSGNIYYSLDGSAPSLGSRYQGAVTIKQPATTLRVMAFSPDFTRFNETSLDVCILYDLASTANGGGAVAVTPADGIWPPNFMATATALPIPGSVFLGWLGDATGTSISTAVSMNRNKFVKAVFGTTLAVACIGRGAVLRTPSAAAHPYGSTVCLTAQPEAGHYFVGWSGAVTGNANPQSFVVSSATPAISAVFAALPTGKRALTVVTHGNGHVDVSPRASYYDAGTVVHLTAVPDVGQAFVKWSVQGSGNQPSLAITLNSDKFVIAEMTTRPQFKITALDGMTPEGFRATFTGELGQAYDVLASTDLRTWDPIGTLTNTFGTIQFTDPLATNAPIRFYEAMLSPRVDP